MAANPFLQSDEAAGVDVGFSPDLGSRDGAWQETVFDGVQTLMVAAMKELGINSTLARAHVTGNFSGLMSYLNRDIMTSPQAAKFYQTQGLTSLINIAFKWFTNKIPALRGLDAFTDPGGSSGGGGGGGSGMTAADIRAQFDLDQLSNEVSKMTRAYLLTEPKDPRGIARAFVEAVVANPAQKLDFNTFVQGRLQADPRWSTIYKLKPKSMDPLQYVSQYTQAATQMLGSNSGVDWSEQAFNAAGLGADPQAWNSRLQRSDRYTAQAPFVAKLQQRVSGLRHVLRA